MVLEGYRDFQEYILDDNSWIVCQSTVYLFSPKGLQDYIFFTLLFFKRL